MAGSPDPKAGRIVDRHLTLCAPRGEGYQGQSPWLVRTASGRSILVRILQQREPAVLTAVPDCTNGPRRNCFPVTGGTEGSNPSPSSAESGANRDWHFFELSQRGHAGLIRHESSPARRSIDLAAHDDRVPGIDRA